MLHTVVLLGNSSMLKNGIWLFTNVRSDFSCVLSIPKFLISALFYFHSQLWFTFMRRCKLKINTPVMLNCLWCFFFMLELWICYHANFISECLSFAQKWCFSTFDKMLVQQLGHPCNNFEDMKFVWCWLVGWGIIKNLK